METMISLMVHRLAFPVLVLLLCSRLSAASANSDASFTWKDVYVPEQCDIVAKKGDHLLLEYRVLFANGSAGAAIQKPQQLFHITLDNMEEEEEPLPVLSVLTGICRNGTRSIAWKDPRDVNLAPIFLRSSTALASEEHGITIELHVEHITAAADYDIFNHMHRNNISAALDMIEQHRGVNAVDEWGQTPLMMAVQIKSMVMVASLLNTRLPKVDVNMQKASGFTALIYAVEKAPASILQALLRRGADPNVAILQEGSRGNTPLHYACLLERSKHAELLLEYGAAVDAVNEHGQSPLQLLPSDAVRSTKLYFKKMFEDAMAKQRESSDSGNGDDSYPLNENPEL